MSPVTNEFENNSSAAIESSQDSSTKQLSQKVSDINLNGFSNEEQPMEQSDNTDNTDNSENEMGGNKIIEKINPKKAKKTNEKDDFDKYSTFQIQDERDFTPIFDAIANNTFVSEEMKNISKELKTLLDKKIVDTTNLDPLLVRMIRYYKLNTATLALHTYNPKVRGDIENITKILKSFVLKNRNTVYEATRHVIIEKKSIDCEFNINVSAADLNLFDIFEKVSLNNLEEDLPRAKTIFSDIYMSWVLMVVIAMSVHNAKHETPEDVKKSVVDVLKDKIVSLNSDSSNPIIKKLINVIKKEKSIVNKPKKVKDTISEEGQEIVNKLAKKNVRGKPKTQKIPKGQKQESIEYSNIMEDVQEDFNISVNGVENDDKDEIQPNDIPV